MKSKKREGTPEKTVTPNASQDTINEQLQTSVIFNEDIEALTIREEDLAKLREGAFPPRGSPQPLKDVIVRKTKPESEWKRPKPKSVKVLKQAPSDARVRPIEFPGGVRVDSDNLIVPHSILGDVNEFLTEAAKRGQVEHLPLPDSRQSSIGGGLTVKYEKRPRQQQGKSREADTADPLLGEDNALKNWQRQMAERKRQQGYICKMIQKAPEQLVMNRLDRVRGVEEERYLIDRTIPLVDYGKGYRVGSEFWKQRELFGDDTTGIHMSLTQTEQGYPPTIEHVGVPSLVRGEKGLQSRPGTAHSYVGGGGGGVNHPWNMGRAWNQSQYLQERKKQLHAYMDELDPHKPEFGELQIVGRRFDGDADAAVAGSATREVSRLDLSQTAMEEALDRNLAPGCVAVPMERPPMTGPSLLFAGRPAAWTGDSSADCGQVELEARVTFECYATQRVMSVLDVTNNGTTVVYYDWKNLPTTNPFDVLNAKVQRFYFNTSGGVILPGDSMKIPFIFKSPNAGIFSEQWQFETRPVLCGGAALVVTLRGVALQEDHYKEERNEIEEELGTRQAAQVVSQILAGLVNGIKTPDRSRSPIDCYITDQEIFKRRNQGLIYHHQVIEELKAFYLDLFPEDERSWREWDFSMETIKELILAPQEEEDEERTENLLQRLNTAVTALSYPHFSPAQQQMYNVGYESLLQAVDGLVEHSVRLRSAMGLADKEPEEFPDELGDGKRGKSQDGKKGAKPDAKGGAKDQKSPEKKGAKDGKASGVSIAGPKVSKTPNQTKVPSRGETTTPTPGYDSATSLSDVAKVPEEDVMETCYKQKLYAQTYATLASSFQHMTKIFDDIHDRHMPPC